MPVLHALWSPESATLRLWAEEPPPTLVPKPARGAKSRVRPHPYAAGPARIRRLLEPVAGALAARGSDWWAVLVMPSTRQLPVPSPESLPEPRPAALEASAWKTPMLAFEAGDALRLLAALQREQPAGLGYGADLRQLLAVRRAAVDLVARGRVVPGIVRGPHQAFEARWLPVADGPDADVRHELIAALPLSGRAAEREGGTIWDAEPIVDAALSALADAAVREALRALPLPPRRADDGAVAGWLRALQRDATLRGDARVEELGSALEAWRADRTRRVERVRAAFRLDPPPHGSSDGRWNVEVLVQAVDIQTQAVPASEVWAGGPALATLGDTAGDLRARLRADVARAGRHAPLLAGLAAQDEPRRAVLDAEEALRFLRSEAVSLRRAGFGVLLPSWWGRRESRLGLRLKAAPREPQLGAGSSGLLGLDQLVDVDWRVVLGGSELGLDELRELAAQKAPLVRVQGAWVEIDEDAIARAVRVLERGVGAVASARDVLRASIDGEEPPEGLPLVDVAAEGWLGRLLGAGDDAVSETDTPESMHGELRPYQRRGLGWLQFLERLGLGACLADDMGLGKTIQLLALLLAERDAGAPTGPTLLVCPMSLLENWRHEAERFAPSLRVVVHHGLERLRGVDAARGYGEADLVLTTYALASRDLADLTAIRWHRVVLDEAQAVKNAQSAAAKAVRALTAPRRVALTGTPVENRLAELWSIMEFLNPGLLGTQAAFQRRFAVPIERGADPDAAEALTRVTRPLILRRLKTDRRVISDLPEKIEMRVYAPLTAEQAALYAATVDDLMAQIEASAGIERRGLILAALTRLKQVCDHPSLLLRDGAPLQERSGKLGLLEEILDEVLDAGERALVFTQYAEMGKLLQPYLAERLQREVLYLHGGVPAAKRAQLVDRFQSDDGPSVFVLSLRAGGTGLNLTAANHVVHFDRWWNPAVEQQATDRAYRIGQTRDVQVRKLVCTGTVEEKVDRLIEEKRGLADRIVGAGESWLGALSTDEVRELVTLAADTTAEADPL